MEVLSRVARLDLEYEELSIDSTPHRNKVSGECLSDKRKESRISKADRQIPSSWPLPTLIRTAFPNPLTFTPRDFQQLRGLELELDFPGSPHQVLHSSITSTEHRRIIFSTNHLVDFVVQMGKRASGPATWDWVPSHPRDGARVRRTRPRPHHSSYT